MAAIRYCLLDRCHCLAASQPRCGKSSEAARAGTDRPRERHCARRSSNSLAEEREKDRRMREGAAAQAIERLANEAAEHEQEVARAAAAPPSPEQQQAERAAICCANTPKR